MQTFVNMMFRMLLLILFVVVPLAAAAFFIISLVRFLKTDKTDVQLRQEYKAYLMISSCIMGVIALAIAVLLIMTMLSLSHM